MAFKWPDRLDKISTAGAVIPTEDGDWNFYCYPDIEKSEYFNNRRVVIFVNGMGNTGEDHARSALALSLMQMCLVVGVYNKTLGFWRDFAQCIADKNQFNGPLSLSARRRVGLGSLFNGGMRKDVALAALGRNAPQVTLFNILDGLPSDFSVEIFAHSQGNLVLSNVLQALVAVHGQTVVSRYTVHTFGSPAVNWPKGLTLYQNAYTFDYVAWLAGLDTSFEISKVGLPEGSRNPFTHGFLEYMKQDPIFVVNRFRIGSFGQTLSMDEEGLATSLARMGPNVIRVYNVFLRLQHMHKSDSDDVAELYVNKIAGDDAIKRAIKAHGKLGPLLMQILGGGMVFPGERRAIDVIRHL